MKALKAIIEKGNDNNNYGIYLPDVGGVYGFGETEQEAKEELAEAIDSVMEELEERGYREGYEILFEEYTIEYVYDMSVFFKKYDYINVSALARKLGINESLMRRYSSGKAYVSQEQKTEIEKGIHDIGKELASVTF